MFLSVVTIWETILLDLGELWCFSLVKCRNYFFYYNIRFLFIVSIFICWSFYLFCVSQQVFISWSDDWMFKSVLFLWYWYQHLSFPSYESALQLFDIFHLSSYSCSSCSAVLGLWSISCIVLYYRCYCIPWLLWLYGFLFVIMFIPRSKI